MAKQDQLGLPTIKDRVVQEIIRMQLEAVYEPTFSEWSYGFRPKKTCQDALKRFEQRFQGINYFVKIDLKDFFGTVNHETLIKLLQKSIKKHKLIKMIYKMLKSGVMKQGKYRTNIFRNPARRHYLTHPVKHHVK
ncbi:reverse transcriptase/maturase family protein [Candidatus Phytoplasma solani]|uniref:reverse transcriptase/maturase family protein n=1 Tax=Candidatus Phytoplasma solani TaxID=69896 RepID=UPI0032DB2582